MRNTLRYMLGALAHYDRADACQCKDMPELERYMLHKLAELDASVPQGYAPMTSSRSWRRCLNFMNVDLSAFYLDIRKDALYCEPVFERSGAPASP